MNNEQEPDTNKSLIDAEIIGLVFGIGTAYMASDYSYNAFLAQDTPATHLYFLAGLLALYGSYVSFETLRNKNNNDKV